MDTKQTDMEIPVDKKLNPVVELLKMMGVKEVTAKAVVYLSGFIIIVTSIIIGGFKIALAVHDFTTTIDSVIINSTEANTSYVRCSTADKKFICKNRWKC